MAMVKIILKDIGTKGEFQIKAESYPEISDEQVADMSLLSPAQEASLRIMEFVQNGLEDIKETNKRKRTRRTKGGDGTVH